MATRSRSETAHFKFWFWSIKATRFSYKSSFDELQIFFFDFVDFERDSGCQSYQIAKSGK